MMGLAVSTLDVPITKTTNAVTGKAQLQSRALGAKGDFQFVIKNPVPKP